MKNRLQQYRSLEIEINNSIDRLELLQMKAASPTSATLTGSPKKASYILDTLSYRASYIVDLENEIRKMIEYREDERRSIEQLVKQLQKPDERAVIRLRYLDGEEWSVIVMLLFGSKPDYEINIGNYTQRVYRLHKSALRQLSDLSD